MISAHSGTVAVEGGTQGNEYDTTELKKEEIHDTKGQQDEAENRS